MPVSEVANGFGVPVTKVTAPLQGLPVLYAVDAGGGGGGGSSMPAGALGIWYADAYTTTPRKVIPNSVTATPVSTNLGPPPRHLFNGSEWQRTNAVVVDDAVTGPDGLTSASTVNGTTTNWFVFANGGFIAASGIYTIGANVKSNTGANQSFTLKFFNAAQTSAVLTATPSWQRFTFTSTTISGTQNFGVAGTVAANIQICDVEVYAGSSDLGPSVQAGHMYLDYKTTPPAVSGGVFDNTGTGKYGFVQFPGSTTWTVGTFIAVVSKTAVSTAWQAAMATIAPNGTQMPFGYENGEQPSAYVANTAYCINYPKGLWVPLLNVWQVYTNVYTGTKITQYVNEFAANSNSATGSWTENSFRVGTFSVGQTSISKYNAWAWYDRVLTKDEVATAVSVLRTRALANSGLAVATAKRFYAAEGDSITFGTNVPQGSSYPCLYGANASPSVYGVVSGISGSTLATMSARGAALDAQLPTVKTGMTFLLSVLIGRNDISGYSGGATQYAIDLATYCDARRAAGWKVVLCTVLPSTAAGVNTQRAILNPILVGWGAGLHYDALCDFAADATMGTDAAGANTSLYGDGTHPTAAGQINLEAIIRPVINAL